MDRETRQKKTTFRSAGGDDGKYIEGYFVVFGDVYDCGWGFTESVDRHAFDKCLHDDVRVLLNHDDTIVLGRTSAGTAEIRVDDHGLWGRVKINEQDTDAVNAWARVERGDVDQASFGFDIISEVRTVSDGGDVYYTLTEVKLFEISVCTFPAYEATSLSARSAGEGAGRRRQFELWRERAQERIDKWH